MNDSRRRELLAQAITSAGAGGLVLDHRGLVALVELLHYPRRNGEDPPAKRLRKFLDKEINEGRLTEERRGAYAVLTDYQAKREPVAAPTRRVRSRLSHSVLDRSVLTWLLDHGGQLPVGSHTQAMAKDLGQLYRTVNLALTRLTNAGLITRQFHGCYGSRIEVLEAGYDLAGVAHATINPATPEAAAEPLDRPVVPSVEPSCEDEVATSTPIDLVPQPVPALEFAAPAASDDPLAWYEAEQTLRGPEALKHLANFYANAKPDDAPGRTFWLNQLRVGLEQLPVALSVAS